MDHVSSWFQAAVLPDRWNVAGVSCGVLSVWHMFALQQTGNPYHCGGSLDKDAAASLLMYCAHDYKDGKRLFYQPYHRARAIRRIVRKLRKQTFEAINDAVIDYVRSCSRAPAHKEPERPKGSTHKPRFVAAPRAWVLVDFLCKGDASKLDAAWNTPYAVACCLFDAHRDIAGEDDTLETLEEEKRFDAYNKGAQ